MAVDVLHPMQLAFWTGRAALSEDTTWPAIEVGGWIDRAKDMQDEPLILWPDELARRNE